MILTGQQCRILLEGLYQDKVTNRQQRLAVRNVTMANFMLEAGLRTTEVVDLVMSDLINNAGKPAGTLHIVRGIPQGHKSRLIQLNERLRSCISMMDKFWWRPDSDKAGNFAFYDQSPLKHITATQLRRIINEASVCTLGYVIRPNTLRRTCAAKLLQKTDVKTVQQFLDYKTVQNSYFR